MPAGCNTGRRALARADPPGGTRPGVVGSRGAASARPTRARFRHVRDSRRRAAALHPASRPLSRAGSGADKRPAGFGLRPKRPRPTGATTPDREGRRHGRRRRSGRVPRRRSARHPGGCGIGWGKPTRPTCAGEAEFGTSVQITATEGDRALTPAPSPPAIATRSRALHRHRRHTRGHHVTSRTDGVATGPHRRGTRPRPAAPVGRPARGSPARRVRIRPARPGFDARPRKRHHRGERGRTAGARRPVEHGRDHPDRTRDAAPAGPVGTAAAPASAESGRRGRTCRPRPARRRTCAIRVPPTGGVSREAGRGRFDPGCQGTGTSHGGGTAENVHHEAVGGPSLPRLHGPAPRQRSRPLRGRRAGRASQGEEARSALVCPACPSGRAILRAVHRHAPIIPF